MFNKYLKYKNKYFKLKNLYGGAAAAVKPIIIEDRTTASGGKLSINESNSEEILKKIKTGEYILKEGTRSGLQNIKDPENFKTFESRVRYELHLPQADSVPSITQTLGAAAAAVVAAPQKLVASIVNILDPQITVYDITIEPTAFTQPTHKIDSHFTEVHLNNSNETQIKVVFDSGNSVKTLTNINYATKLGLEVTPVMATTKNILAFNNYIDLSTHMTTHDISTLKIPVIKSSKPKTGIMTFDKLPLDTVQVVENTEFKPTMISDLISKCKLINSMMLFSVSEHILNKIMASIGIPHGVGLGGAFTFYDKKTIIDMIIPTTGNKKLNVKLNCLVDTSSDEEESHILVCNNDIRKLSKLGIILDYPQAAHIKREQIEIKKSELDIIMNKKDLLDNMILQQASAIKKSGGISTFSSAITAPEVEALRKSSHENHELKEKLFRELKNLFTNDIKAEEI